MNITSDNITSRQRSSLMSLASSLSPAFQLGKDSLTPEFTDAVSEFLEKNELVKIHVLKNNASDRRELAGMLAERTRSIPVQVIGRMIVLYRYQRDPSKRKIKL